MSRQRRGEVAVCAVVVAAFATLWAVEFGLRGPSGPGYAASAVLVAIVATPWVIAAWLLWRAWWARRGPAVAAMDGPARLLAAAVAVLPEHRRDWGAAMAAELAQVGGGRARWRFAAGCLRAALFPPRGSQAPVLAAAALAAVAVAGTGLALGAAVLPLRVFAVTFVALVGAMATLSVARSRPLRQAPPGPAVAAAGLAGVAACTAALAYSLVEHPEAAAVMGPDGAIVLAVAMAASSWLVLAPPRGLASHRLGRRLGAGAALLLALGFLWTTRQAVHTGSSPLGWVALAPQVIFLVASAVAARLARSFRAGVQAATWTALLGGLLLFAIGVPEAMYQYGLDGQLLLDGEGGRNIGTNLNDFVWVLIAVPLLGLPFGVIGAAAGAWRRRYRRLGPRPGR
jgi:hypothetical protein